MVYRLLSAGCVDEKIYQRQLKKQAVASMLETAGRRGRATKLSFDSKALRELFTYKGASCLCDTVDVLRGADGEKIRGASGGSDKAAKGKPSSGGGVMRESEITVGGKRWQLCWNARESGDAMVRELDEGLVSCVWWRTSTATEEDDELDAITQAEAEAEEATEADGEEEEQGEAAHTETGESSDGFEVQRTEEDSAGAASGDEDADGTVYADRLERRSESPVRPRGKRVSQRADERRSKRRVAVQPASDDEDEAFPSYQPTSTPAEAQASDTRTAEEREVDDMAELQQVLGGGGGGSSGDAVGAAPKVCSAVAAAPTVGSKWSTVEDVDELDVDMSD